MSEYWALDENDELYIPDKTPDSISYDTEHINYGSFYMTSDKQITANAIPIPVDWEQPYPTGMWYMTEDLTLVCGGMPEPLELSAFNECSNLSKMLIPRSVKRIGEISFKNTALSEVTIASDCEYSPTSFPSGCVINFYDDEEENV